MARQVQCQERTSAVHLPELEDGLGSVALEGEELLVRKDLLDNMVT